MKRTPKSKPASDSSSAADLIAKRPAETTTPGVITEVQRSKVLLKTEAMQSRLIQ